MPRKYTSYKEPRTPPKYGKATRGRKPLYVVGPITNGENKSYVELVGKVLQTTDAARVKLRKFQDFTRTNALPSGTLSLTKYAAVLLHHSMDPGSVVTVLQEIISESIQGKAGEPWRTEERPFTTKELLSTLSLDKAHLGTRHARDFDLTTLVNSINSMPHIPARSALALMTLTGARNADILNIRDHRQLLVNANSIQLDVKVAKNRRDVNKAVTLTISHHMSVWNKLSREVQNDIASFRCSTLSTGLLNIAIHKVLPGATSYSFRRGYIHAIIDAFTTPDGTTTWDKVTEFTLHFNVATLKAFYAKKARDIR